MSHKILVFIEQVKGVIAQPSLEALGDARRLAGPVGGTVSGLLFGHNVGGLASTVMAHGADEVLLGDDATFAEFRVTPTIATPSRQRSQPDPPFPQHTTFSFLHSSTLRYFVQLLFALAAHKL